jgi:SOS-response transcriptional repressor LexA
MDMQGLVARIDRRLAAMEMTAAEASRKATGSPDTIRNWKRTAEKGGKTGASHKALEAVADVLSTNVPWLTDEIGPEVGPAASNGNMQRVPVLSMVSASRLKPREGVSPGDITKWIHVDDLGPGDWIALVVEGDSMNRIAPDQSTILVNRADDALIDGRYYVFNLENGETTFKTFKRDPMRLQPYSTNPDHMSIPVNDNQDLYVLGRVKVVIQHV